MPTAMLWLRESPHYFPLAMLYLMSGHILEQLQHWPFEHQRWRWFVWNHIQRPLKKLGWSRSLAVFWRKKKTWFPDFQENIWRYPWIETPHVPSVVALGNWFVSKTLTSPESTLWYNSRYCCCDMPWLGICLGFKWGNSRFIIHRRRKKSVWFCRICIQLYGIILIVG